MPHLIAEDEHFQKGVHRCVGDDAGIYRFLALAGLLGPARLENRNGAFVEGNSARKQLIADVRVKGLDAHAHPRAVKVTQKVVKLRIYGITDVDLGDQCVADGHIHHAAHRIFIFVVTDVARRAEAAALHIAALAEVHLDSVQHHTDAVGRRLDHARIFNRLHRLAEHIGNHFGKRSADESERPRQVRHGHIDAVVAVGLDAGDFDKVGRIYLRVRKRNDRRVGVFFTDSVADERGRALPAHAVRRDDRQRNHKEGRQRRGRRSHPHKRRQRSEEAVARIQPQPEQNSAREEHDRNDQLEQVLTLRTAAHPRKKATDKAGSPNGIQARIIQ